jgi:hypothetical protein
LQRGPDSDREECWWYRHALAPGAFGGQKASALPTAEQLPLKLAMRRHPISPARRLNFLSIVVLAMCGFMRMRAKPLGYKR